MSMKIHLTLDTENPKGTDVDAWRAALLDALEKTASASRARGKSRVEIAAVDRARLLLREAIAKMEAQG